MYQESFCVEHKILDVILRMEEKRKAQIRKKYGDMKKQKNKATNEL